METDLAAHLNVALRALEPGRRRTLSHLTVHLSVPLSALEPGRGRTLSNLRANLNVELRRLSLDPNALYQI